MSSIERAGYPMRSKSKTFLKKSLVNDHEIKLMEVTVRLKLTRLNTNTKKLSQDHDFQYFIKFLSILILSIIFI